MRGLTLSMCVVGALLSASASTPASAQEGVAAQPAPIVDSNGPTRQGNMCRQRIQPGQPEGLAFYAPCTENRTARAQPRTPRG